MIVAAFLMCDGSEFQTEGPKDLMRESTIKFRLLFLRVIAFWSFEELNSIASVLSLFS